MYDPKQYNWNEPQYELYRQLVVPLIFTRTIVRSTVFVQSDAALDRLVAALD